MRRERIYADELARGRSPEDAQLRADSRTRYADTFFVPEQARWSTILADLHRNVGDGLNKALGALEESNTSLDGVLRQCRQVTA